jgi:hypothetical protein
MLYAQTVSPADRYEGSPEVALDEPAGITWRNQAASPNVAPAGRAGERPQVRRFIIRRAPGALEAPGELDIWRELDRETLDGPARIIVRRQRIDDMAPRGGEWLDEGRDDHHRDHHDDSDEGVQAYDEGAHHGRYPGSGDVLAQGPCCSGGMITETITTTTTYHAGAEDEAVHERARPHRKVRIIKRKLRR